jgi:hypothetical protein
MRCFANRWSAVVLASLFVSSAASASPRYRLVNATESGKAFVAHRKDAPTLQAALRLTRDDITAYVGSPPSVFSAYGDARDPGSGGATFLAMAGNIPLKGLVTVKLGEKSTRVAVVFVRADAPADAFGRLLQPPGPSGEGASAATSEVPLRTYNFPSGVGSIGLAEGWTTNSQGDGRGTFVRGPEDQGLALNMSFTVQTPQSPMRGRGGLVAPFTTPASVLATLMPQLSQMNTRSGGPYQTIDNLVTVADQRAMSPRGLQSMLRYGITDSYPGGASRHYQVLAQVSITPVSAYSFILGVTQLRAPDAIFERDRPLMLQMVNSVRLNDDVIRRRNGAALARQKQWFAGQQAAHRAQVAAFDAHNKQWSANERAQDAQNQRTSDSQLAAARRDDGFDELIRGYRTVEDTQTGERRSADLGNVDKIVDDLNERDPGRYRAIPMRDEYDPLPR